MIAGRTISLLLIAAGAVLAFFSAAGGLTGLKDGKPAGFPAAGVACGTLMMCVGAVLDYLHTRNRQP